MLLGAHVKHCYPSELKNYWKTYGGFKAVRGSPYLWISFALSVILTLFGTEWYWYLEAKNILPNMIGFSLGGYAIMLAFGDSYFLQTLKDAKHSEAKEKEEFSAYLGISASLAHFVIVEIVVLIIALFYDALSINNKIAAFLGCWGFLYALSLALAATLAIFFLSRMYDKLPHPPKNNE